MLPLKRLMEIPALQTSRWVHPKWKNVCQTNQKSRWTLGRTVSHTVPVTLVAKLQCHWDVPIENANLRTDSVIGLLAATMCHLRVDICAGEIVMIAVRMCMGHCLQFDLLLQLPGAVLLIGRTPFINRGVSNYCALTKVFLLPRIQLWSLCRLNWLLLPYDYCHDYFLVCSMLKLSSLKPSKYTHLTFASIGRFVTMPSSLQIWAIVQ